MQNKKWSIFKKNEINKKKHIRSAARSQHIYIYIYYILFKNQGNRLHVPLAEGGAARICAGAGFRSAGRRLELIDFAHSQAA